MSMFGRERTHDLSLDGVYYMCARDQQGVPVWSVERVPEEAGRTVEIADQKMVWPSWHLGAFFSEQAVPGTYDHAEGVDASQPGALIMGPAVTTITNGGNQQVSDLFIEAGEIFALAGRYCYHIKSDDTTDTITATGSTGKDFGAGAVATKSKDFQSLTYIGFSSATNIYSFDGTTWTQATDDVKAQHWAKDYFADWRLWRSYSTNTMNSVLPSDNPLTAADWGSAYTVGDNSTAITGLADADDRVYVMKTDGVYGFDRNGAASNVLRDAEAMVHSSNGLNTIYSGGVVYYPSIMGLLAYDRNDGAVQSVHPGANSGYRGTIRGIITAQRRVGAWHYATIYNGTDSWLLKGRYPTAGESLPQGWVGPMIWHTLAKLTGVQCDCMIVSASTSPPRLYFGHGTNVAYITIPRSGNVLAEADAGTLKFATTGSIWFTPHDWGASGANKALVGLEIENEGLTSSTNVAVYVSLDGGSYQSLGTCTAAGRTSLLLPDLSLANRLQFRLDFTNNDSTTTPRVKAITGRAAIKYVLRDLVRTTVICMDNVKQLNGATDTAKTGAALLTHLTDRQSENSFTEKEWWTGSEVQNEILLHDVRPRIMKQEGYKPAAYVADLAWSVLRQVPEAWTWDGSATYDSSYKWG